MALRMLMVSVVLLTMTNTVLSSRQRRWEIDEAYKGAGSPLTGTVTRAVTQSSMDVGLCAYRFDGNAWEVRGAYCESCGDKPTDPQDGFWIDDWLILACPGCTDSAKYLGSVMTPKHGIWPAQRLDWSCLKLIRGTFTSKSSSVLTQKERQLSHLVETEGTTSHPTATLPRKVTRPPPVCAE